MKFGKKTFGFIKILFVCVLTGGLAFGFNMVRPEPFESFIEITQVETEAISEISTPEMLNIFQEGQKLLIDARSAMDFSMGHLPGALNIPYQAEPEVVEAFITRHDVSKSIVIYCDGMDCGKSLILANKFAEAGIKDIYIYTDGIDGWISAGQDLEVE